VHYGVLEAIQTIITQAKVIAVDVFSLILFLVLLIRLLKQELRK
jgi:hypothetical protein